MNTQPQTMQNTHTHQTKHNHRLACIYRWNIFSCSPHMFWEYMSFKVTFLRNVCVFVCFFSISSGTSTRANTEKRPTVNSLITPAEDKAHIDVSKSRFSAQVGVWDSDDRSQNTHTRTHRAPAWTSGLFDAGGFCTLPTVFINTVALLADSRTQCVCVCVAVAAYKLKVEAMGMVQSVYDCVRVCSVRFDSLHTSVEKVLKTKDKKTILEKSVSRLLRFIIVVW